MDWLSKINYPNYLSLPNHSQARAAVRGITSAIGRHGTELRTTNYGVRGRLPLITRPLTTEIFQVVPIFQFVMPKQRHFIKNHNYAATNRFLYQQADLCTKCL